MYSYKNIVILKSDRTGDLSISLNAINRILIKHKKDKIIIFLSKINHKYGFFFPNINKKIISMNLGFREKISIFKYLFFNDVDTVYILTPKNFYYYLPFIFRKIKKITLDNINSKRDWRHAKDYVYAMWKMLQIKKPQDFVIGTGKTYSIKDFIKLAFDKVNLDYQKYIKIDKNLFRPNDKVILKANPNKANKILKWVPKTTF